ncbi:MAG TPA: CHAT domain-containing protein [Thermoanaerobaculia bacterium]|nr:CHAT domain-containing protein [Thermoanaerobaculia bacterium]
MNVGSTAVLAKLRDEVRAATDAAIAVARAASFRRTRRREKLVGTLELPPSLRPEAEKQRERLIWCGRVLDALLQRHAVTSSVKVSHVAASLAAYVMLERELPANVPEGRSRKAFELELRELQRKLEDALAHCASVVNRATPHTQDGAVDIHIEAHGETARINGTSVSVPFTESDHRSLRAAYRKPRSAAASDLVAPLVDFGQKLFQLIAPAYPEDAAVRLHLEKAGWLATCAWELLHDGRQFLALQPSTPVVRVIAGPSAAGAPNERPLRILLAISSPQSLRMLDATEERRRMENAIGGLILLGLVELDVVPDGTLDTLRRKLRSASEGGRPYDVWHFVGHGRDHAGRGELAMEDDEHGVHWVGGDELQVMFGVHPPLRLVILNACESGIEGIDHPRGGLARTLIGGCGAATVIATQFQISDSAAIVLAQEIYGAYAAGADISAAVTEARRAIFCRPQGVEWMTPVVFTRTAPDAAPP